MPLLSNIIGTFESCAVQILNKIKFNLKLTNTNPIVGVRLSCTFLFHCYSMLLLSPPIISWRQFRRFLRQIISIFLQKNCYIRVGLFQTQGSILFFFSFSQVGHANLCFFQPLCRLLQEESADAISQGFHLCVSVRTERKSDKWDTTVGGTLLWQCDLTLGWVRRFASTAAK